MTLFRWSGTISIPLLVILSVGCGSTTPEGAGTSEASADSRIDTVTFSAEAADIAGFTIDTARLIAWQSSVTVPGRLMLDPSALETMGSITEGRIASVVVRVGDRVRAGQALVMIHSHEIMDARSELAASQARLAAATAERDLAMTAEGRAQRLFDARALSRAELERAQVSLKVATAAYDAAVADRDHAQALVSHLAGEGPLPEGADDHDVLIITPIAGVVVERMAQPGTVVLPGSPLITVGDPRRLQLQLRLTESAASGVGVGSVVRYSLTESPGDLHTAVVTRVAPTVDTLTRTIEVLARPEGIPPGRAESFVQANVLGKSEAQAVVVPMAAIQVVEGDTVVFVAERRNNGVSLRAVPVRAGRRSADRIEVIAGLTQGTQVIVRGAAIAKAEVLRRRGSLG